MSDNKACDVSFDELQHRFGKNVYQTGKGQIRLELIKADMLTALPEICASGSLKILDAGAGMGQMAIWLAEKGHAVTMADISANMLEQARSSIAGTDLSKRIRILDCSIQKLPQKLAGETFDLILLHGVITWMEKPLSAISSLLPLLQPSGKMSIMFFNRDKLILKWGINGQTAAAMSGKGSRKGSLTPKNPLSFAEVADYCHSLGLKILSKAGIRIFYRFFLRFPESYAVGIEDFIQLEKQYCRREPFASLGEHIHVTLERG